MEGVPTNQLIIKHPQPGTTVGECAEAEGRACAESSRSGVTDSAALQKDLRRRLERAGEVLFLKAYPELQRTVVIFETTEECTTAKRRLEEAGYEAQYGLGADRETVLNFHLAPPPEERMFLLSPPPSPPEGWKPLYEGINSIPHLNVEMAGGPSDHLLLEGDHRRGMPAITLDDWEKTGVSTDDSARHADSAIFGMDE